MSSIPKKSQPVSVIIPTYNGLALLQKNLPAVLAAVSPDDEVWIVDDASTDQTVEWFQDQFAANKSSDLDSVTYAGQFKTGRNTTPVFLLQNKQNQRFAKTVNRGVDQANHQLLFVVNNDVSPHPDCLKMLRPHFADETVFGVGCLELEDRATAAAAGVTPKNIKLQPNKVAGGKNELFFKRGLFQHRRASDFSAGPTAWVSGGSGMFDRQKWQELKGFDPIFAPAYWEDIDLSRRAQLAGWKTLFEPKAKVDHNHESTNQDVFNQLELASISWRNADIFTRRHAVGTQLLEYWLWKPYWWWQRFRHRQQLKNGIMSS